MQENISNTKYYIEVFRIKNDVKNFSGIIKNTKIVIVISYDTNNKSRK